MDKKIRILYRGPYEVSGDIPLVRSTIDTNHAGDSIGWKETKQYETGGESYTLCRCGHSSKKPFCDGTHIKIGFTGEEVAPKGRDLMNLRVYSGPEIDLVDEESLCATLRFCDRGATVWRAVTASEDPQNKELAINEACNCGSGRLTIITKDGKEIEPDLPQEIGLVQDTATNWRGPLYVKGKIKVVGANGKEYFLRNRMTLCRCGESSNMPFCDSSHLNCLHMKGFDE